MRLFLVLHSCNYSIFLRNLNHNSLIIIYLKSIQSRLIFKFGNQSILKHGYTFLLKNLNFLRYFFSSGGTLLETGNKSGSKKSENSRIYAAV